MPPPIRRVGLLAFALLPACENRQMSGDSAASRTDRTAVPTTTARAKTTESSSVSSLVNTQTLAHIRIENTSDKKRSEYNT